MKDAKVPIFTWITLLLSTQQNMLLLQTYPADGKLAACQLMLQANKSNFDAGLAKVRQLLQEGRLGPVDRQLEAGLRICPRSKELLACKKEAAKKTIRRDADVRTVSGKTR